MIKMIVTDLDDTLLHTDKTISLYTKEVIKRIHERGIKTVFATARGASTKKIIPLELFDANILMNGANAFIDGVTVYDKTIPPVIMKPLLQKLTEFKMDAAAEIGGIHYANFDVQKRWNYIHNYCISDFSELPGNADKLYAVVENASQVETIAALLPCELYLHVSKDNLAMIMHKEATKLNAILAVAKKFNIELRDIITFGDDINDKEMLSMCGIGVAMSNALNEIKEIADYICDTNDNDGVARWLTEQKI